MADVPVLGVILGYYLLMSAAALARLRSERSAAAVAADLRENMMLSSRDSKQYNE